MVVFNSSAAIPAGYAVQLDTGAEWAAHKYLDDSVDYEQVCVAEATSGLVLGVTEKAIPANSLGEIVTKGLVRGHADDTIVADDPVVVISGGKMDNEGGTGIHSDAYYGTWLEAVTAETLGWMYFWASPLPRIAT
jgi:hypothetical protein